MAALVPVPDHPFGPRLLPVTRQLVASSALPTRVKTPSAFSAQATRALSPHLRSPVFSIPLARIASGLPPWIPRSTIGPSTIGPFTGSRLSLPPVPLPRVVMPLMALTSVMALTPVTV